MRAWMVHGIPSRFRSLDPMDDGALDDLPGRLELQMLHLVGEALARCVDRADLVQGTMLRLLRSDATAARGSAEAWLAAFGTLTPEHRRVLGLRRFEGLSAAETAARMGRSETAVHSLFRRALVAWEEAANPSD